MPRHTDARLLELGQLDQWAAERLVVPCPICRGEGTLLFPDGLTLIQCWGCDGEKWVPRAATIERERFVEPSG